MRTGVGSYGFVRLVLADALAETDEEAGASASRRMTTTGGDKGEAARRLKISLASLYRKLPRE